MTVIKRSSKLVLNSTKITQSKRAQVAKGKSSVVAVAMKKIARMSFLMGRIAKSTMVG